MKKLFIFLLLISLSFFSISQPLNYKDKICIESTIGTTYRSPMIGIFLDREIKDDAIPLYINIRVGYYQNLLSKPNYMFIQSGFGYNGLKKLDIGIYWFNLQAELPRKITNDPYYLGYDGPFAIYLRLKNEHSTRTNIYLEGSYSIITHIPAFRFTIRQDILNLTDLQKKINAKKDMHKETGQI